MRLRCKVQKAESKPTLFNDLEVGSIFVFKGQFNKPCIKARSDFYYSIDDAVLLDFSSGCIQHVYLCEIVTPLEVKIVI